MKKCCVVTVVLLVISGSAAALPIDLNTFTADPAYDVVVAPDGSSATIYEDPVLMSVWLYNDAVDVTDMLLISFHYDFVEGQGNDDVLNAYLYDPSIGPSAILADFFVEDTGAGSVMWDLTGISLNVVGLEFDLNAYDFAADSFATITNVELTPIPEPASLLLLGCTLIGIASGRRMTGKAA